MEKGIYKDQKVLENPLQAYDPQNPAYRIFEGPRSGHSVEPSQCCPAFSPNPRMDLPSHDCFGCVYADFHLTENIALEVGICGFPEKHP